MLASCLRLIFSVMIGHVLRHCCQDSVSVALVFRHLMVEPWLSYMHGTHGPQNFEVLEKIGFDFQGLQVLAAWVQTVESLRIGHSVTARKGGQEALSRRPSCVSSPGLKPKQVVGLKAVLQGALSYHI